MAFHTRTPRSANRSYDGSTAQEVDLQVAPGADAALDLLAAAERILRGQPIEKVSGPVGELLQALHRITAKVQATETAATIYGLSEREREVIELASCGFSTNQIGATLFISPSTVSFHLSKIYAKTGASSRFDLADLVWGKRAAAAA